MARKIKTIFQVRRALSCEWEQVNPILRAGEPGFALDTHLLKIGDGNTPWNLLPCYGRDESSNIYSAESKDFFPAVGNSNIIYRAINEKVLYQWNDRTKAYEQLGVGEISTDIDEINGGDASG